MGINSQYIGMKLKNKSMSAKAKIDAGLLIHKIINDQGKTLKSVEFDLIWYFIDKCSLSDFEKIKDLIYDADE